jgi:hypothetical protein
VVPEDGFLKNFCVIQNIPEGNGGSIQYMVLVDGVGTALGVSLASTDVYGINDAVSIPVSAGERVSVRVTKALPIGESPRNISSVAVLSKET